MARVMRIGSFAEIRISNRIEDVGWRRFTTGHGSDISVSVT